MSQSPDLAICRFRNLKISQSWNLGISRLQISDCNIWDLHWHAIGVRWCVHKMSDVPEPWDTWITRCATWDVQWHVPHTMSWVCTTWYVPHDMSRDTCVCMFGARVKLDGTACLRYSPYHTQIFLDRAIGHCPMCQLHTHSCVRATCACTPYLLCCNLRMLDWSPTHTTQIAKCGDLQIHCSWSDTWRFQFLFSSIQTSYISSNSYFIDTWRFHFFSFIDFTCDRHYVYVFELVTICNVAYTWPLSVNNTFYYILHISCFSRLVATRGPLVPLCVYNGMVSYMFAGTHFGSPLLASWRRCRCMMSKTYGEGDGDVSGAKCACTFHDHASSRAQHAPLALKETQTASCVALKKNDPHHV